MLYKIFLIIFIIAVVVMGILTFITYNQLQSIGFSPTVIVENYTYYEKLYWQVLIAFSLVLLILSNAILWTNKTAWALWLTFLFSAVFIMLDTWWLGETLFDYKKQNGLWEGGFSLSGIAGALVCVGLGIGVFADHFLVLKLRERMYPQLNTEEINNRPVSQIDGDKFETEIEKDR